MAKNNTMLEDLRAQIDAIDNSILKLLAKRVKIVRDVGKLKASMGGRGSVIRPGREAEMVRRIASHGGDDMPHAAALAQMWRLIIASAISIEQATTIATVSTKSNRECYWLAREYFGAFTPMTEKATVAEVLQDVMEEDATIAVVPLYGREGPSAWWSRLESDGGRMPKIFAKLPFVQMAPSTKEPLVAIGYVEPEPTGQDESLWVIRAEERFSLPTLEKLLKESEVEYTLLDNCRVLGVSTTHHYLLKIDGFMDQKSRKLASVAAKANEMFPRLGTPVSAHYLGSYAVPLLLEEDADND